MVVTWAVGLGLDEVLWEEELEGALGRVRRRRAEAEVEVVEEEWWLGLGGVVAESPSTPESRRPRAEAEAEAGELRWRRGE